MQIKIQGRPQMSFEQFRETFRQVFGRDMSSEERQWLQLANFSNDFLEHGDSTKERHRSTRISRYWTWFQALLQRRRYN